MELLLYAREGCHLCDQMLEELDELSRGRIRPRVVDIDGDPELVRRHGLRVPVLELAGEELCHGRLDSRAVSRLGALLDP